MLKLKIENHVIMYSFVRNAITAKCQHGKMIFSSAMDMSITTI